MGHGVEQVWRLHQAPTPREYAKYRMRVQDRVPKAADERLKQVSLPEWRHRIVRSPKTLIDRERTPDPGNSAVGLSTGEDG